VEINITVEVTILLHVIETIVNVFLQMENIVGQTILTTTTHHAKVNIKKHLVEKTAIETIFKEMSFVVHIFQHVTLEMEIKHIVVNIHQQI
jgi:hypothetical protein